ncbi:flagellar hook-basal body complex protein [Sedimentitalea arenosa]|jgi:flagellar basal-body rod protein FlgF|uniref:Flagellar basal-body rod protein FlgF n=1 Tax=Sedimentitalea arenosa TaxID=2798803 RepID=A0A8J7J5E6_9RHOB|nr:flagellar hook-basal body complex protein [Arenibacterium arenosum]MBJ6371900.1 flagellar hook-basal body complex protein [Arenibacterium arenosum]
MEAAGYVTLSRQSGLMREMRIVANNIANAATTGYRQEGLIFSEFVRSAPDQSSLSMSQARVRNTSMEQGSLTQTNGNMDFAIEGDGFFLVETPRGERLTRAGSFATNADGDLVTPDGYRVLDAGGAPVFVPPDAADISVSSDGTLSVDGRLLGQIGLVRPTDPLAMVREDGVMFRADDGFEPAEDARVLQGFVEGSNVNPILQIARMIDIQRAYEMGQSFLETEDQRIRNAAKTLMK